MIASFFIKILLPEPLVRWNLQCMKARFCIMILLALRSHKGAENS